MIAQLLYFCVVHVALAMAAVPVAKMRVGTFQLLSSTDPKWSMDVYKQNADGTFVGYGNMSSKFYTYYGEITKASCYKQPNGNIAVVEQWWLHDMNNYAHDVVRIACAYNTFENTIPTRLAYYRLYEDTKEYSEAQMRAGNLPGACPFSAMEASSGIKWMAGMRPMKQTVFGCREGCGSFGCSSKPALAKTAVPVPEVRVGTFHLLSSNDPKFSADIYTQNADGTFVGYGDGTWMPSRSNYYTYYGEVTQTGCSEQPDGNIAVVEQYWFRDMISDAHDTVHMVCVYYIWKNAAPPTQLISRVYQDTKNHSESQIRAGNLPGSCPSTALKASAGITWMAGVKPDKRAVYSCKEGCGAFRCAVKQQGRATTTAEIPTRTSVTTTAKATTISTSRREIRGTVITSTSAESHHLQVISSIVILLVWAAS